MADSAELQLDYRFIVVGKRPFSVWDRDIALRNMEYLDSIDVDYYAGVSDLLCPHLREEPDAVSHHAAITLRLVYCQALETLFALLAATLQAPYAVPAWINLYKTHELRDLVDTIRNRGVVLSVTNRQRPSWVDISDLILANLVLEDKEKESEIRTGFANLWARFSAEFVDQEVGREYNSLKHGLRVRAGGFALAMGLEEQPGTPPPAEAMRTVGQSEYGTSHTSIAKIGELAHHVQFKRHSRNWSPVDLCWGLMMVSLSMKNVLAALRILNGVNPSDARFSWPTDMNSFDEPWKRGRQLGVTSISGVDVQLLPGHIRQYTTDQIRDGYAAGDRGGRIRVIFTGD